ncbi:MAG: hypothetical protein ACI80F_001951 [Natronomonas sp.]|jgi:hypothetical protein
MSEPIVDETEAIPETLREREQWVCWREEERDGKLTKIPVTPEAGGVRVINKVGNLGEFRGSTRLHRDGARRWRRVRVYRRRSHRRR